MKAGKGKTIALAIAGLGAAGIIAAGFIFREAIIDWWHRIPVTRTWGDLLAQDPIDLGNGVKVRLGIEATRCPRWSGVLVYCLTEGYDPSGPVHDDDLGPLRVALIEEGVRSEEISEKSLGRQSTNYPDRRLLFARSIPISVAGRFEVQVSSRDGKVLRKAFIQGTKEPFHPWMPLENLRKEGTGYMSAILNNRPDGIAMPRWRGYNAIRPSEAGQVSDQPNLPLPNLMPGTTKPEVLLDIEENHLVLTSDHQMWLSRPESHLLARWWINGEPYIPAPCSTRSEQPQISGGMLHVNDLRIKLEFDPDIFGARKGDRIGLQLLHVPMGWEFFGPDRVPLFLPAKPPALLTNRIEFTVP